MRRAQSGQDERQEALQSFSRSANLKHKIETSRDCPFWRISCVSWPQMCLTLFIHTYRTVGRRSEAFLGKKRKACYSRFPMRSVSTTFAINLPALAITRKTQPDLECRPRRSYRDVRDREEASTGTCTTDPYDETWLQG